MRWFRNLAALPMVLLAIVLWWLADWLLWMSGGVSDAAEWVAGVRKV
jgi:hypothetical protein